MNKIQIVGRLTADPELGNTSSGVQVCRFTVAVNRRFNREEADFFPVTAWRELAVNCNKFLAKGSQVGISGSLQIRRYDDQNGIKRTTVDLQAEEVEFLTAKSEQVQQEPKKKETPKQTTIDDMEEVEDDDMPF